MLCVPCRIREPGTRMSWIWRQEGQGGWAAPPLVPPLNLAGKPQGVCSVKVQGFYRHLDGRCGSLTLLGASLEQPGRLRAGSG